MSQPVHTKPLHKAQDHFLMFRSRNHLFVFLIIKLPVWEPSWKHWLEKVDMWSVIHNLKPKLRWWIIDGEPWTLSQSVTYDHCISTLLPTQIKVISSNNYRPMSMIYSPGHVLVTEVWPLCPKMTWSAQDPQLPRAIWLKTFMRQSAGSMVRYDSTKKGRFLYKLIIYIWF